MITFSEINGQKGVNSFTRVKYLLNKFSDEFKKHKITQKDVIKEIKKVRFKRWLK